MRKHDRPLTDWERKNRNGYNSHLMGKLQSDNPYYRQKDPSRWDAWNSGWLTAEQHQKASPQVYSHTAREYRAQMEAKAYREREEDLDGQFRQRLAAENT